MSEAPLSIATPKEISETISIEQNNAKYSLHITSIGETLTFLITFSEDLNNKVFVRKLALKEIKDSESHQIFMPYSCKEFIDYLKTLSEKKKISLTIKQNIIFINLDCEFLFKKSLIEIELFPEDKNFDSIVKELYKEVSLENLVLKNKVEELEKQMKEFQKLIEPNININKLKLSNQSVIMKENEFEMIHLAIKSRINKEIKELKKLYQATIDGDGAINFHSRCDNIPNTLVLIKSAGNRRFGGFTSAQWSSPSSGEYKDDLNAFLFSLDKKKIYSYKMNGSAIYNNKNYGPCFGGAIDICISYHGIQEKHLYTRESSSNCSYNYNGDGNALSEDGKASWIYALEYEVFQVIFE
jgi:hypothetical protein